MKAEDFCIEFVKVLKNEFPDESFKYGMGECHIVNITEKLMLNEKMIELYLSFYIDFIDLFSTEDLILDYREKINKVIFEI